MYDSTEGLNMSDYITLPSSSSVDMLRFRVSYRGEPGEALEWFDKVCADMVIEYGRPDEGRPDRRLAVRYPRSLRLGTYRELLVVPAGDSSVSFGFGLNAKGEKNELREGFLEFNPAKTYPSDELQYLYGLLCSEPRVSLELVRWDFATDYPLKRRCFCVVKDGRKYGTVIAKSYTAYLGRRNENGFVKVYDKQAEMVEAGKEQADALTRVEVTVKEPAPKLGKRWPCVLLLPDEIPEVEESALRLLLMYVCSGGDLNEGLQAFASARTRKRYRAAFKELCSVLAEPADYGRCRANALAWQWAYGGRLL